MNTVALRIDDLAKRYRIGKVRPRYRTLRETVTDAVTGPFRRVSSRLGRNGAAERDQETTVWALQGVSFEVNAGEVIGIIGRNGAGKSTLLKILSRVTDPTRGSAEIYGRVGSLLEVGTGFHPELTGRENVYLNGAILGMRKREIDAKFDEIVAFSEVEKFIDTPVKHFSSGMGLRLAFAVAAHLEPEILIVDEVLAVGDVRFQKKCMSKMQDVGKEGRTVLFVSHNMPAITRLCPRAILLDQGLVVQDGPAHQVVGAYLREGHGTSAVRDWPDPARAPGGEVTRLRAVRVVAEDGEPSEVVDIRRPVTLEMEYDVLKAGYILLASYDVFNDEGVHVMCLLDQDAAWRRRPRPVGRYVTRAVIPGNFLSEGTLFVDPCVITMEPPVHQFYEREAVAFQVVDSADGDSARGDWGGKLEGAVRPLLQWETRLAAPAPRDEAAVSTRAS